MINPNVADDVTARVRTAGGLFRIGAASGAGMRPVALRASAPGRLVRFARDVRAAAAIEAAAALPFLVFLGVSLFEIGGAFYKHDLMQAGVRDAARYLARVAVPTAAETAAKNLAVTGSIDGSKPTRVKGWQTSHVAVSYISTANPPDATTGLRQYRGGATMTTVRVATAMPYAGLGLLATFNLGTVTIRAAHEERHVGW